MRTDERKFLYKKVSAISQNLDNFPTRSCPFKVEFYNGFRAVFTIFRKGLKYPSEIFSRQGASNRLFFPDKTFPRFQNIRAK